MSLIQPDVVIRARDFSPGYNDTGESDTLPPGASPSAKNGWFESVEATAEKKRAVLAKIPGSRLINPAPMAAQQAVTALYPFIRASAPRALLAVCAGTWHTWDEIATFTAIAGATGYTGPVARAITFDHEAIFHGGVAQGIYNGMAVRTLGFAGPTNAPAMTATGTGLSGTYVARYTWWNQSAGAGRGHESNPSPVTTPLTLANQARHHTRPSSPPPAATHWRIYVRRTDTNEVLFKFTAEVPIASLTHTEAIIDTARTDPLPGEVDNTPPPVMFALMAVWKGHAIGIPAQSNDAFLSALNDAESWHPSDIFRVGPGDGEPVTAAKNFGTELLLQKPHRTYHFIGDEVPFGVEELHSAWGCVSQEAGVEVDRRYFAWDEVHGPYWTDLSNWVPLGDLTISGVLRTINRQALAGIRAVHDEVHNLVIWAIPTAAQTRKRMLLAYHYLLGTWLPPITGLEYASLATYQTATGAIGTYAGDEWGRVHALFVGTRQSVPSGTTRGVIGTVIDDAEFAVGGADFFLSPGGGLVGLPVAIRSPAGQWQWRRIAVNTTTLIQIDTVHGAPWSPVPQPGWEFIIGGIEWIWRTPRLDFDAPKIQKRLGWLLLQQQPVTQSYAIEVRAVFDGDRRRDDLAYRTKGTGAVWGEAIWGESLWGGSLRRPLQKGRITRVASVVEFQFENFYPDQPVVLTSYEIGADVLPRRIARGAA